MSSYQFFSRAFLVLMTLLLSSTIIALAKDLNVEIKTLLGINKTVGISEYSDIKIELYEGETASININLISSIKSEDQLQKIETTWGEVFNGKCLGNITITENDNRKEYSLNSLKTLIVVTHIEGKTAKKDAERVMWNVSGVKSNELKTKILKNISFEGTYYSTAGYIMGGSNRIGSVNAPYIKVKGEEMLIQLDDFMKFDLEKRNRKWFITVYPPEAEPVTGELVLKIGETPLSNWRVKANDENGITYKILQNTLNFSLTEPPN